MRHIEADRICVLGFARLGTSKSPRVSYRRIHVVVPRDALPGNVKRSPMID
jgi:hypothetical protein